MLTIVEDHYEDRLSHCMTFYYLRNIRETSSQKTTVDDSVVAYIQAGTARECQMLRINVPVDFYLNRAQIILNLFS